MTQVEEAHERYRRAVQELAAAGAALDKLGDQDTPRTVRIVQKVACDLYRVRLDELTSPARPARISGPRQLSIWFLVQALGLKYGEAGHYFNRDRATAELSCTTVEDRRRLEKKFLAESDSFHLACITALSLNAAADA